MKLSIEPNDIISGGGALEDGGHVTDNTDGGSLIEQALDTDARRISELLSGE